MKVKMRKEFLTGLAIAVGVLFLLLFLVVTILSVSSWNKRRNVAEQLRARGLELQQYHAVSEPPPVLESTEFLLPKNETDETHERIDE